MHYRFCLLLPVFLSAILFSSACSLAQPAAKTLVTIDGAPITEGDLEFLMISRRVPPAKRIAARKQVLDLAIEQRLMQNFLASRKVQVPPEDLDARVEQIYKLIRLNKDDPQKVLSKLGMTEATLRRELALPAAWRVFFNQLVTPESIREFYKENKTQFDGTQLRARQIFLKVPANAEESAVTAATQKLSDLRTKILAGTVSFEAAAKEHSQSPSASNGGDVGLFPYQGKMPVSFTKVAFALKGNEISEPFRSPFGVHICQTTEIQPGDLSLEDVRTVVLNELSRRKWMEILEQQRKNSEIQWQVDPDSL